MNNLLILLLFSSLSRCLAVEIFPECHLNYENKCIVFHQYRVTYSEAETKCEEESGRLVIIGSPTIQDLIYQKLRADDPYSYSDLATYWIGLHDRWVEGNWQYSNGSSLGQFQAWNTGEPNSFRNLDEDCVELVRGRYWNDEICRKRNRYICEIDMTPGIDCDIKNLSLPNAHFKDCYEPKVLQHGHSLPYICNDGYKATAPNAKVKCFNGMWKISGYCQTSCKLPQLSKDIIFSSVWKSSYALEEEIKLRCRNGFFSKENKLLPETSIKCIGPNQWSTLNFICIPSDNFSTSNEIYEQEKYNLIEFTEGDALILKCQDESALLKNKISYKWFKDDKVLSSFKIENMGFNYTISPTGELKFSNTIRKNEGIYICIRRKIFTQHFVDVTIFRLLQKKLKCSSRNETNSLIVNEKDSVVLSCSSARPYTTSFLWVKNGEELGYNDEHHLYLPNGNLLITNINMDDNDRYSCIVTDKMSSCVHYHHHILSVIPLEEERCGEKVKGIYESYPWFLSLSWEDEEKPFCYGVLVSKQWIVSTALCVSGIRPRMYPHIHIERVFEGNQLDEKAFPFQSIEKIIIHPEFKKQNLLNDVAMIKLSKTLPQIDNNVLPCLMNKDIEVKIAVDQRPCNSLSKGLVPSLNAEEDKEHVPLNLDMILKPNDKCQFFGLDDFKQTTFCAQMADNESIASFEGVGSPFITEINEKIYIKGIYNLAENEKNNRKHFYFIDISPFYDWLMSHLNSQLL